MNKLKWLCCFILLVMQVSVFIFFGILRFRDKDATEAMLLATYYKEYIVGIVISLLCYIVMSKLLKS